MEVVVLGLLIIQDLTVYQINQAFNSGIALIYSASYGSILSAIKKLISENEITFTEEVENGRNKKIYHITEKGRARFFQWMQAEIPERKLETIALTKVFFLGLIDSIETKRNILLSIITAIKGAESQLNSLSHSLSQLQLDENEIKRFGYQLKTLDYGIRSHHLAREWAEELLSELRE